MSGVARCNLCETKPFEVPWSNTPADSVSAVLMQEHLKEAHGITTKSLGF